MVPKDGGNRFSVFGTRELHQQRPVGRARCRTISSLAAEHDPTRTPMKKVCDYGIGRRRADHEGQDLVLLGQPVVGQPGLRREQLLQQVDAVLSVRAGHEPAGVQRQSTRTSAAASRCRSTPSRSGTLRENWQEACACWMASAARPRRKRRQLRLRAGDPDAGRPGRIRPRTGCCSRRASRICGRRWTSSSLGRRPTCPGAIAISDANYPGIGAYQWGGLARRHARSDYGEPQQNDNINYRFASSYITGSHAVKIGLQGHGACTTRAATCPRSDGYTLPVHGGVPTTLTQFAVPFKSDGRIKSPGALRVGPVDDQAADADLRRAVRPLQRGHAGDRPPGGAVRRRAALRCANDIPNYNDITPRVGAAYDRLRERQDGHQGVVGSVSAGPGRRLADQPSPANALSPARRGPGTTRPASQRRARACSATATSCPDCDLTNPAANGECGAIANAGFGTPAWRVTWDPTGGRAGACASTTTSGPCRAAGDPAGVRRERGLLPHRLAQRPDLGQLRLTASDINLFCITAPVDARLGAVSGQPVCGNTNGTSPPRRPGQRGLVCGEDARCRASAASAGDCTTAATSR